MKARFTPDILEAFGLYVLSNSLQTIYSKDPEGGIIDIDLDRLANQQPCFKSLEDQPNTPQLKKIIICDWSLPFVQYNDDTILFWNMLLCFKNAGCELYVWQGDSLIEITDYDSFSFALLKLTPASLKEIEKTALEQREWASDQLYLYDYFNSRKLLAQLIRDYPFQMFQFNYKDEYFYNDLLAFDRVIYIRDLLHIDTITLQKALESTRSQSIQVIHLADWSDRALTILELVQRYHPEARDISVEVFEGYQKQLHRLASCRQDWHLVSIILPRNVLKRVDFKGVLTFKHLEKIFCKSWESNNLIEVLSHKSFDGSALRELYIHSDHMGVSDVDWDSIDLTNLERLTFPVTEDYESVYDLFFLLSINHGLKSLHINNWINFSQGYEDGNSNAHVDELLNSWDKCPGINLQLETLILQGSLASDGTSSTNQYEFLRRFIGATAATVRKLFIDVEHAESVGANTVLNLPPLPNLEELYIGLDKTRTTSIVYPIVNATTKLKYLWVRSYDRNALCELENTSLVDMPYLKEVDMQCNNSVIVYRALQNSPSLEVVRTYDIVLPNDLMDSKLCEGSVHFTRYQSESSGIDQSIFMERTTIQKMIFTHILESTPLSIFSKEIVIEAPQLQNSHRRQVVIQKKHGVFKVSVAPNTIQINNSNDEKLGELLQFIDFREAKQYIFKIKSSRYDLKLYYSERDTDNTTLEVEEKNNGLPLAARNEVSLMNSNLSLKKISDKAKINLPIKIELVINDWNINEIRDLVEHFIKNSRQLKSLRFYSAKPVPSNLEFLDDCISEIDGLQLIDIDLGYAMPKTRAKYPHAIIRNVIETIRLEQQPSLFLDADTLHSDEERVADLIFLQKKNCYPHPADYRSAVLDGIYADTSQIQLFSRPPIDIISVPVPEEKQLLRAYQQQFANDPHVFFMREKKYLTRQWRALTGLSSREIMRARETDVPVDIGFSPNKQQHFAKLADSANLEGKSVDFRALVDSRPTMRDWPMDLTQMAIFGKESSLFRFAKFVIDPTTMQMILVLDDNQCPHGSQPISLELLIAELIAYCQSFTEGAVRKDLNGIDLLNEILSHDPPRGACRHRSIVFVALAKALNIQARVKGNPLHGLVEVQYDSLYWEVDLGGYPIKLEIKNQNLNEVESEDADPLNNLFDTIQAVDESLAYHDWEEKESVGEKVASSFTSNLMKQFNQVNPKERNALLIVDSLKDVRAFYVQIVSELDNDQRCIYVDHLSQMNLTSVCVGEDGTLEKIDSELARSIKSAQSGDILLINWSDYQNEHVGYNSIIDDEERRLDEIVIPDGVCVIGLVDKRHLPHMGEDLITRFGLIKADSKPSIESSRIFGKNCLETKPENKKILRVQCDGGDFWKQDLLGLLQIEDQFFQVLPGGVVKACDEKYDGIEIVNGSWGEREFDVCMLKLLHQKYCVSFGRVFDLPDNFFIVKTTEPYSYAGEYSIELLNAENTKAWTLPLNKFTFHHFLHNYQVIKGKISTSVEGWLEQCKQFKPLTIFVNGLISDGQWQRLMRVAATAGCHLRIITAQKDWVPQLMWNNVSASGASNHIAHAFRLQSHNVAIGEVILDQLSQLPVAVVTTNDIDYVANVLEDDNKRIVSIVKSMRYADVWDAVSSVSLTRTGLEATSQTGDIWQWLEQGKTVILKGQFSQELAAKMSTLFSRDPFLWLNGQKRDLLGQLIIVTDVVNHFSISTKAFQLMTTAPQCWFRAALQYPNLFDLKEMADQLLYFNLSYAQIVSLAKAHQHQPTRHPFESLALLDINHQERLAKLGVNPVIEEGDVKAQRLAEIVQRLQHSPTLLLIGPSGTGKSTIVLDDLKPYYEATMNSPLHLFVGWNQLAECVNSTVAGEKVLLIEEATAEQIGRLDQFESLFDNPPGMILGGKFIPTNMRIIFTGNFLSYAGRYQHDFFMRHGSVMLFDEWPKAYLENYILLPVLKEVLPQLSAADQQVLAILFLDACEIFKRMPTKGLLTIRNLHMMCLQARLWRGYTKSIIELAQWAIFDVVKNHLTPTDQIQFANEIQMNYNAYKKVNSDYETSLAWDFQSDQFILTPSRHAYWRAIHDQMSLREIKIQNPALSELGTRGMYVEGPSCSGKSAHIIEAMRQKGYIKITLDTVETPEVKEAIDNHQCYYHIGRTKPEKLIALLTKAFHQGAIIVLDEFNSVSYEAIYNTFLMGRDLAGNKAQQPGFYCWTTGNPPTYTGRKVLSLAAKSRFTEIKLESYPLHDLKNIIKFMGFSAEDATMHAEKFFKDRLSSKIPLNERALFKYLKRLLRQQYNTESSQVLTTGQNGYKLKRKAPAASFFVKEPKISLAQSNSVAPFSFQKQL